LIVDLSGSVPVILFKAGPEEEQEMDASANRLGPDSFYLFID